MSGNELKEFIVERFRLLGLAKEKYKSMSENLIKTKYFDNIILECFINYEPSKRGNVLQKLIIQYLNDYVTVTPSTWDKGDFMITTNFYYDYRIKRISLKLNEPEVLKHYKTNKNFKKVIDSFEEKVYKTFSKFFEIKTSYLNKNGYYSIGNIRLYQDYDYLLMLLVDCEDEFGYKLVVLPKSELNKIKMAPMYGTKNSNEDSKNSHFSFSIKKGSEFERNLDKWVIEGGFRGLKKFCSKLKTEFKNTNFVITDQEYEYIVDDEFKQVFDSVGLGHMVSDIKPGVISFVEQMFEGLEMVKTRRGRYKWRDKDLITRFFYGDKTILVHQDILYQIITTFDIELLELRWFFLYYFRNKVKTLRIQDVRVLEYSICIPDYLDKIEDDEILEEEDLFWEYDDEDYEYEEEYT